MRADLSEDQLADEVIKQELEYLKYIKALAAPLDGNRSGDEEDYSRAAEEVERWVGRFRWKEVWFVRTNTGGYHCPNNDRLASSSGLGSAIGCVPSRRAISREDLQQAKNDSPLLLTSLVFSTTPVSFRQWTVAQTRKPVAQSSSRSIWRSFPHGWFSSADQVSS